LNNNASIWIIHIMTCSLQKRIFFWKHQISILIILHCSCVTAAGGGVRYEKNHCLL
jgi:hypothetical protein